MSRLEVLPWLGVVLAACCLLLFLMYYFAPGTRARRTLRRFRTCPIGNALPNSRVKIAGRAHAIGEMLVAPLSGRMCVGYQVMLLRWFDGSMVPARVRFAEQVQDFFLVDDTGAALIDAHGATLALELDWRSANHADDRGIRQLAAWGLTLETTQDWHRFELVEAVIEPGETIAARGILQHGSPIRLRAPDGQRLLVSDDLTVLDRGPHLKAPAAVAGVR